MRMSISDQILPDPHPIYLYSPLEPGTEPQFELLIKSVSYRQDFGFTLGASAISAAGLFRALRLISNFRDGQDTGNWRYSVQKLTNQLLASVDFESNCQPSFSQLHSHIFTMGVIIFLNRQTIDPPPYELLSYVQSLFAAVREFECLCYSTPTQHIRRSVADITLWPIFVAAVECFRDEEMDVAKRWMQSVSTSGIGNRKDVISVVMKVWEIRETLRQSRVFDDYAGSTWDPSDKNFKLSDYEMERGSIQVSWQAAMRSQGVDLLLI